MTTKFKKTLLVGVAAIAVATLAACSVTETKKEASRDIAANLDRVNRASASLSSIPAATGPGNVQVHEKVWLGDHGVRTENGQPLPQDFEKKDGIFINSSVPLGLAEIANKLADVTGIPVTGASSSVSDLPGGEESSSSRSITMAVDYEGPLSGFLNSVASRFNVNWIYRNGVIQIFAVETRTFTVLVPSTETDYRTQITSSILGGEESNGDSNASEQRLNSYATYTPWKRIEEGVKSLIPSNGATFVVSQETGTVTVTAAPTVVKRVGEFIKQQNAIMSRQVAVTVRVLSVDIAKNDRYSFDTKLALEDVARGLGLTFSSMSSLPAAAASGGGSLLFAIAEPTKSDTDFQHLKGSEANVEALSERSDTSLLTSATVITTNNQPTPVHVGTQQNYLKKAVFTQGQNSDSVELEPGSISTGFQMLVTPRILSTNKVMLQYSLGLSELVSLDEVGNANAKIQLPEIKTRSFLQNTLLRSGDTLILSGFEQNKANSRDSNNGFWGAGMSAGKERAMIMILITPMIIQDPSDAAFAG